MGVWMCVFVCEDLPAIWKHHFLDIYIAHIYIYFSTFVQFSDLSLKYIALILFDSTTFAAK